MRILVQRCLLSWLCFFGLLHVLQSRWPLTCSQFKETHKTVGNHTLYPGIRYQVQGNLGENFDMKDVQ